MKNELAFAAINILIVFMIAFLVIYSMTSLVIACKDFKKFDELQKKALYESFAISFLVILTVHLLQVLGSVLLPHPYSKFFQFLISVGDSGGIILTNNPLMRLDSFAFDSIVFGVTYYVKRKKYGLD